MGNKIDLRSIRKGKSLSQQDIAEQVGISQNHFSNIELGVRQPSPRVAQRIASILGFPDEWYRLLDTKPGSPAS